MFSSGQVSKLQEPDKKTGKLPLVYGIDFITATQQALSPQLRAVVPLADAPNILISLTEADTQHQFVFKAPVTRFIPQLFNGYTQYMKPRVINFTNSSFFITQTGTLATTQSILLLVYWKYEGE